MILCFSPSPDNKKIYTFERFRPGGVNRALSVESWLSGKGINSARALAAMHERVLFTGLMGEDLHGDAEEILRHAGIESRLVFTQTHTRSCITAVDRASGTATELIEEAPKVQPVDAAALIATFRELLEQEEIDAAVAAGSLPAGCQADTYKRIAEACLEREVPLVLDAAGGSLREALEAHPAAVKINAHEFAAVFPPADGETLPDAVRRMSLLTGGLVIVTGGAGNVVYSRAGEECASVQPPAIEAVNPIGSGDAFSAGVAIGLIRNYSDARTVRLGVAMGTANALSLRPGDLHRDDVHRIMTGLG